MLWMAISVVCECISDDELYVHADADQGPVVTQLTLTGFQWINWHHEVTGYSKLPSHCLAQIYNFSLFRVVCTFKDCFKQPSVQKVCIPVWSMSNRKYFCLNAFHVRIIVCIHVCTPPLKSFRSGSLWKYVNGCSQNMIDIKRLNDNYATWACIIENNISGHIFQ